MKEESGMEPDSQPGGIQLDAWTKANMVEKYNF